jgi:glycosyltransferase involved in cell wall biosynthesis
MEYSAIIPVYNEEENILPLYTELTTVLQKLKKEYEIIFIDDGSTDKSIERIQKLILKDKNIRAIKLRRNFGQTAALDAGIKNAKGNILITLDADLQNDPNDIPKLLAQLNEYDLVTGWRMNRKDTISKKIFSKFANILRRRLTGDTIHDAGCTLKVFKKECFSNITLFGEMHRYMPTIVRMKGFKVTELPVHHRPRKHGKTKYNYKRLFKGLFDLLFLKFWMDFSARPIHFFGTLAVTQFGLALLILIEQIIKAIVIRSLSLGPLLMLSVLFVITGFLTFIFGFLAEIMVHMYYREKPNYEIEEVY